MRYQTVFAAASAQCSNKLLYLKLIHIQILTYYPISANVYLEYSVFKCNVIANHLPSLFPFNIYLCFANKCQFAIPLSHLCSMIVHKTQWTGISRASAEGQSTLRDVKRLFYSDKPIRINPQLPTTSRFSSSKSGFPA